MTYLSGLLPEHELIVSAKRETLRMYPPLALRELIANALIHQDFRERGIGPMIEIFNDRIEISNPGKPMVNPDRLFDGYLIISQQLIVINSLSITFLFDGHLMEVKIRDGK